MSGAKGGLKALAHGMQKGALEKGYMPAESVITSLNPPHKVSLGHTPGKLRLMIVSERVGAESPPLTSEDMSDLRVFTGARVVYALSAAKVAGAVAQSGVFDYRRGEGRKGKHSHFGAPLSSVEVKLVDSGVHKTSDEGARGEVSCRWNADLMLLKLMLWVDTCFGTCCCWWRSEVGR